ncbi:hypothetical protein ACFQMH_24945 [Streptomyces viridiviolaceus]|uniref:Uncharacterized protein n=1 Tax=Streptomyces viridiviolaceus TaxID=68282 RepID=A0ABW2E950_9ACTN
MALLVSQINGCAVCLVADGATGHRTSSRPATTSRPVPLTGTAAWPGSVAPVQAPWFRRAGRSRYERCLLRPHTG